MSELIDSIEDQRKAYDPLVAPEHRVIPRSLYVDIQTTDLGQVGVIRLQADLDDPASVIELRARFDQIMEEGT